MILASHLLRNNPELVNQVLHQGAKANAADKIKRTPLHLAIQLKHMQVCVAHVGCKMLHRSEVERYKNPN